ncbi:MAG: pseudouridine synthase [Eubacteriales bacterium]|nr:pseudouridine synthase [Eubacteriales bacterium]
MEELMRLQKYLAHCGVAGRRKAEELIASGAVQVNGQTVREMGIKVGAQDIVHVRGERVKPESVKYYIMYNKPRGEVSTASDPEGRTTVLDRFKDFSVRLYPVGRLDFDSEGLIFLTNDGEFAKRVTHPRYGVKKTYIAKINSVLSKENINRLRQGVFVMGEKTRPAMVRVISTGANTQSLLITIGEGKNRQIRRMIEAVGSRVLTLKRIQCGVVRLGKTPLGKWRHLTESEVKYFLD